MGAALNELPPEFRDLTPRQRAVLAAYYFDGKLESEIAEDLNISQAAVSQQLASALSRIAPYAEKLSEGRQRIKVRPMQLSLATNI